MFLFDKFYNQTVIKGELVAVDPIHIGTSAKDSLNPVEIDSSVLKDNMGNPLIPGSSIKGVVRSYYESVVRSIDVKKACDVLDKYNYCTKEKEEEIHQKGLSAAETAELAYKYSCDACRLFGGRELAGKLKFKDCYAIIPKGKTAIITEFRDGVGIDRNTGAAKGNAKYDFEIVPKGTKFDFCLIADNLDEKQTKALDFVFEYLQSGEMAVGGMSTRGFGRVKLENVERKTVTADDLRSRLGL